MDAIEYANCLAKEGKEIDEGACSEDEEKEEQAEGEAGTVL